MHNKIIENLSNAIYKSGKTISEISRKSGISRPFIYKILNKETPTVSIDTVSAICSALNINTDYIYSSTPEKKTSVKIPVLGVIPAGIPIEAIEDVLDYEEISEDMARRGNYFALKVKGDSMLPTIKDGDVVIVKQQDDADSGQICVVMINGYDATLKEIKKNPQGVWILPHNPSGDFKPSFFANEEIVSLPVRIIGVAVEIRRTL